MNDGSQAMSHDPLEQLAQLDVPPVPVALEKEIHQRLNSVLVVGHVMDFALRALPYAILQFLPAMAEAIAPGKDVFGRSQSSRESSAPGVSDDNTSDGDTDDSDREDRVSDGDD